MICFLLRCNTICSSSAWFVVPIWFLLCSGTLPKQRFLPIKTLRFVGRPYSSLWISLAYLSKGARGSCFNGHLMLYYIRLSNRTVATLKGEMRIDFSQNPTNKQLEILSDWFCFRLAARVQVLLSICFHGHVSINSWNLQPHNIRPESSQSWSSSNSGHYLPDLTPRWLCLLRTFQLWILFRRYCTSHSCKVETGFLLQDGCRLRYWTKYSVILYL